MAFRTRPCPCWPRVSGGTRRHSVPHGLRNGTRRPATMPPAQVFPSSAFRCVLDSKMQRAAGEETGWHIFFGIIFLLLPRGGRCVPERLHSVAAHPQVVVLHYFSYTVATLHAPRFGVAAGEHTLCASLERDPRLGTLAVTRARAARLHMLPRPCGVRAHKLAPARRKQTRQRHGGCDTSAVASFGWQMSKRQPRRREASSMGRGWQHKG